MRTLLLFLAALGPAHAVQQYIPRPQLCAEAELVVLGEVTTVQGRWADGGPERIESLVDVAVTRVVKGPALDDVALVVPGGTAGELTMDISEAPHLRTDHRYLLLLRGDDDGTWRIVGAAQGAIELKHGDPDGDARAIASLEACHAE